jgi:hypothetical protein
VTVRRASLNRREEAPLACPGCGASYPASARFCDTCGLPLVVGGPQHAILEPRDERHERARKIKPQFTEGPLIKVAYVRNQVEGEFLQGLLLEEGVPSILRRSAGFDVPDFLAAGPRDVLVAASGAATAREVLLENGLAPESREPGPPASPGRLLAGLLGALALGLAVLWILSLVVR